MVLTTCKRVATLALVLAAGLVSAPAAAQYEEVDPPDSETPEAKAEGKALADRGYALFQQGDYAGAIELFKRAERVSHSPMIVNFLAQSYERLGKIIEAAAYYQQLVDEQLPRLARPAARRAQAEARTKVPVLRQRVPRVQLEITGVSKEQVKVKLDNRELTAAELAAPIRMNPGKHVLSVTAPQREPVLRSFEAHERQLTTFAMHFAPVPGGPGGKDQVTVGSEEGPELIHVIGPAAAFGVGGTGLLVALISGSLYLDRADALKERCPNDQCMAEFEEERSTLSRLGTIATVGFVVGLVGVTTGTLWWLLSPDSGNGADEAQASYLPELRVGPGMVQLRGQF